MFFKIVLIITINLINFNALCDNKRLIIGSTTSTYDSGLLKYLNFKFEKKFNIKVHVLAQGTGQVIELGKNGDIDILVVHDPISEISFVKNNYGLKRHKLMYNDYILIGPKNDNEGCKDFKNKLLKIKNKKLSFISRGDRSGTHKKEKKLWENFKIIIGENDYWYKKNGQGMGPTL